MQSIESKEGKKVRKGKRKDQGRGKRSTQDRWKRCEENNSEVHWALVWCGKHRLLSCTKKEQLIRQLLSTMSLLSSLPNERLGKLLCFLLLAGDVIKMLVILILVSDQLVYQGKCAIKITSSILGQNLSYSFSQQIVFSFLNFLFFFMLTQLPAWDLNSVP